MEQVVFLQMLNLANVLVSTSPEGQVADSLHEGRNSHQFRQPKLFYLPTNTTSHAFSSWKLTMTVVGVEAVVAQGCRGGGVHPPWQQLQCDSHGLYAFNRTARKLHIFSLTVFSSYILSPYVPLRWTEGKKKHLQPCNSKYEPKWEFCSWCFFVHQENKRFLVLLLSQQVPVHFCRSR